ARSAPGADLPALSLGLHPGRPTRPRHVSLAPLDVEQRFSGRALAKALLLSSLIPGKRGVVGSGDLVVSQRGEVGLERAAVELTPGHLEPLGGALAVPKNAVGK